MSNSTAAGAAGAAATPATPFYKLYRRSTLGVALFDSLDELIQSGHINPQLAMRVAEQFDKSTLKALEGPPVKGKTCTVKGKLGVYRSVDEVWTFILHNPTFKFESSEVVTTDGKVKVVACKAGGAK